MGVVDDKKVHFENASRCNNFQVTVMEASPNFIKLWDEFKTIVK